MRSHLGFLFLAFAVNALAGDYPKPRPTWSLNTVANPFLFVSLQKVRDVMAGRTSSDELAGVKDRLLNQANIYLNDVIYSVMNKNLSPYGSQDKHDFYAQGPYYWPDPTSPKAPWIYKDGQPRDDAGNLQLNDRKNFVQMADHSYLLAIAFYLTRDSRYAKMAARYLKAWFIAPATKMNENLDYSNVWPNGPRSWSGVLTGAYFCEVIDAVNLLGTRDPSFTPEHRLAVRTWFQKYYRWLTTDPFFKGEGRSTNNHGTWYDVQRTCIAIFLGKKEEAIAVLKDSVGKRLATQVAADGSQPLELVRTKPLHYSIYNLDAFFQLALLGEQVGVDLWTARAANGATIKLAYDYLLPHFINSTVPQNGGPTYDVPSAYGSQRLFFAFLAPLRWTYTDAERASIKTMDDEAKWNFVVTRLIYNY